MAVVVVVVVAVGAAVLSSGAYQSYPRSALMTQAQRLRAPAWTRPCFPSAKRKPSRECAHVAGRIVWIQQHDPDGDGDRHLAVVARLHLRLVKVQRKLPVSRLPAVGTWVDAVGFVVQGASGRAEIDATRLRPGGPAGV